MAEGTQGAPREGTARRASRADYRQRVLAQQTVATIADERPLLSADGAARHMGTSRWTVYRLHHAGLLKAVKVGTRFKFRPADIDDYLNRSSDDDDRAAS